jgi:transporter family protein
MRSSVFISFLAGSIIFRERKSKLKFVALLGVVLGLCLISLGKG